MTNLQNELLEAIKSGVKVCYMPYMGRFNQNPYYWREDTMKRCTSEAKALLRLGHVEKCEISLRGHKLVIKQK